MDDTEATSTTEAGDDVDARAAGPTWVVGVDGSDGSHRAATWAVTEARRSGAHVELVSAWSLPSAPALPPVGPLAKYWDTGIYETAALDEVAELAERLGEGTGLEVTGHVAEGHAASVLVHESLDADLLVIGSRGRGGFARLVLGSTSTQCATHAHVPTVVVPPGDDAPVVAQRVLVAVDGSENSLDALRWALRFAGDGPHVEAIGVWDLDPLPAGIDQVYFPEATDVGRRQLDEQVDGVLAEFDAGGVPDVTRRFEEGSARSMIAAAAKDADLLVVGARGRGGVSGAVLGSVSTWLLHHVDIPVVVVPHAG